MKKLILMLCLVLPIAASADTGIVSFEELVTKMSEGGKRQFVYPEGVAMRFGQTRIHADARALSGPDVYAAGLEILKTGGLAAVRQESGSIKIVPSDQARSEALPVYPSMEELPATDEFCTLTIALRFARVRDLISPLQAVLPDPRNLVWIEATNEIVVSDFASKLRTVARIVRRLDVGQEASTWRITLTVLEGTADAATAPEGFDVKKLSDATGRKGFSLLGDGMTTLSMGGIPADRGGRGMASVRLWGGEKLAANIKTAISEEGELILEDLVIWGEAVEGKAPPTLLQTRLALKSGVWTIAGSLPAAGKDSAARIVLVKAEPVK